MSNPGEADLTPIESARQLAEWFEQGAKPQADWRIGTEHEKFGFRRDTLATPPYAPDGIRAILEGLQAKGWAPILDAGNPIGLKRGGASVSLEPAGQLELSGDAVADLHQTRVELGGLKDPLLERCVTEAAWDLPLEDAFYARQPLDVGLQLA